jgi:hypothetical protein
MASCHSLPDPLRCIRLPTQRGQSLPGEKLRVMIVVMLYGDIYIYCLFFPRICVEKSQCIIYIIINNHKYAITIMYFIFWLFAARASGNKLEAWPTCVGRWVFNIVLLSRQNINPSSLLWYLSIFFLFEFVQHGSILGWLRCALCGKTRMSKWTSLKI